MLNRDDARVWGLHAEAAARVYGFSRKRRLARGAFLDDGWVVVRDGAPERIVPASRIALPGAHNLENVLAAALIGRLLGAPPASMRRTILAFRGLEHRLEDVLRVRGVRFVNDSKATTVDATLKALASFDRPIVLILGGRGKGGDFSPLRPAVGKRVRSVVLVGEAADKIEKALGGVVPVARAANYREVVRTAFGLAERGDVVLLAPACTSWDMFKDFEERGRTFKREVRLLAAGLRRKGSRTMSVRRRLGFDVPLLAVTIALVVLGVFFVFSSSGFMAGEKYNQSFHFMVQQVLGAVVGLVLVAFLVSVKKSFFLEPPFVYGLLGRDDRPSRPLPGHAERRPDQPLDRPRRPALPAVGAGQDQPHPVPGDRTPRPRRTRSTS